jgi:hypothetical protein
MRLEEGGVCDVILESLLHLGLITVTQGAKIEACHKNNISCWPPAFPSTTRELIDDFVCKARNYFFVICNKI